MHTPHHAPAGNTMAQLDVLGTAVAQRLPGTWTSTHLDLNDQATRTDLVDRLWDQGIAHWALNDFVQPDGGCLILGPKEQRLLLLRRPLAQRRRAPYVVSGLVPGWAVELAQGRDPANAISIPADPVRAAALIARRLLSRYEDALHAWTEQDTLDAWWQSLALHAQRSGTAWRRTGRVGQQPTTPLSASAATRPPTRSR
ncbi:hypothetical protein [Streptacidiphilus jiangxiensis]|nr:hypothetical protein [Streptacidiphilus jiangxiensis]